MAGLTGTSVKNTYKDLLTIAGPIANQGIESSVKQIFDGEGVGSPVWLSTNLLQVGTDSSSATLSVYGNMTVTSNLQSDSFISASYYSFKTPSGPVAGFSYNSSTGRIRAEIDFETKASVVFLGTSQNLTVNASTGAFQKDDGTKGNITLEDTSVKLQKGSTDLLEVKEDGTIKFQNINSYPSSSSAGDIVLKDGNLEIYQ